MCRKRTEDLLALFTMKDDLCFCNDITKLFEQLEILCDKTSWWLFIDTSKDSIKAVLLHNGNTLPSVPIAYSTTMKDDNDLNYSMMTLIGIFVQILRLWLCLLVFSSATINFAASCVYGIPEQELTIMYTRIDRFEKKLSKENATSCTDHL